MGGKKHQVNEFDICVGRVMVMLRARMGMTQRELGDKMVSHFSKFTNMKVANAELVPHC